MIGARPLLALALVAGCEAADLPAAPAEPETAGAGAVALPPSALGTPADTARFHGPAATPVPREVGALWERLAETPLSPDGMVRTGPFPAEVAALDGTTISLTGYMMPLSTAPRPRHFLLVGVPLADCAYCIPNGAAGAVEVQAPAGVPLTLERITLRGRFHALPDDPSGVLFRLLGAFPA